VLKKDSTYLYANFLLASLYERDGDLKNMEKEYRSYLKKSHLRRKGAEDLGLKDRQFSFIKKKFDYYGIPLEEPSSAYLNVKYWVLGAVFALSIALIITVLIKKMSEVA